MGLSSQPFAGGENTLNFLLLVSGQGLMRDLEEKEKELNKLKLKTDGLLNNNHPASDKIEVRCICISSVRYT